MLFAARQCSVGRHHPVHCGFYSLACNDFILGSPLCLEKNEHYRNSTVNDCTFILGETDA